MRPSSASRSMWRASRLNRRSPVHKDQSTVHQPAQRTKAPEKASTLFLEKGKPERRVPFKLAQVSFTVILLPARDRVDEHQIGAAPDQLSHRFFQLEAIQVLQYPAAEVKGAIGQAIQGTMIARPGIDRQTSCLAVCLDILHIIQQLGEDAMTVCVGALRLAE